MVSLALAVPHTKRQSCVNQDWAVQGFSSFTADPGPTGVSHISFTFVDPNTGASSICSRSLAPGSGQSPADPDNFYPCQDPTMQYKFDGKKLTLEHTLDCAGTTETASGNTDLVLQCIHYDNVLYGTNCAIVTFQVNVPVSSLVA
ncbi:hypothetical protein MMC22_005330 [Lobaria immixta]|nr:hypothetical protein [Lobaria immixta]